MSSARPRPPSKSAKSKGNASGADQTAPEFLPPLKPRPRLTVVIGILLVLWLIYLVALRLKTVHPDRAAPSQTPPTAR